MPLPTPQIKVLSYAVGMARECLPKCSCLHVLSFVSADACRAHQVDGVREQGGKWAHVILHGDNYDEAYAEAARLVQQVPGDAGDGWVGIMTTKQSRGGRSVPSPAVLLPSLPPLNAPQEQRTLIHPFDDPATIAGQVLPIHASPPLPPLSSYYPSCRSSPVVCAATNGTCYAIRF